MSPDREGDAAAQSRSGEGGRRSLLVLAPLRAEAHVLRMGAPDATVLRSGTGPRRARATAARAAGMQGDAVAVAGVAGALSDELAPGDLVVATELRARAWTRAVPGAELLAAELRRRGLRAVAAPVASEPRLVRGGARDVPARSGAIAVDMESAWLAAAAAGRPLAVVRAIADTPQRELHRPPATALGDLRALRALRAAAPVLVDWAAAVMPRDAVLAAPRASCAGVTRAVEIVERALADRGPPLYVRRQIVHNAHVVADLEDRGVVFVEELDEVPTGATVVFSAHGVAPSVRAEADRRGLDVIDATCPLVEKVHREARRFAAAGRTVVVVGHEEHDEVRGTVGEAPDRIRVVADAGGVAALEVEDPERIAWLTQTTLAADDALSVVDAIRARFPAVTGPARSDICFATQNRQDAARALAAECDLVLVVGSANSSNANRLVEVVQRAGCRARLIDDERGIELRWLTGSRRVGITAAASTPERVVGRVLAALTVLGPLRTSERVTAVETTRFKVPTRVNERG